MAVVGAGLVFSVACSPTQAAAPPPTATVGVTPTVAAAYQVQVRMQPQDPQLGRDENVVIQATFRSREGRPVSGGQMSAVVNYPSGPKTYTSEITTFPDGRVDLAVPVAPAPRGVNVRVEVVMRYQGQEYRQAAGFNVR
jgi:hypothetical protein